MLRSLDGCDSLHNVDLLKPSDPPKFPSTASSNPVPDNILPTVTTAPNASPKRTFETELGAAGDHDSPNPDSKEKDALDPPLSESRIPHKHHGHPGSSIESPSLRSVADTDATIMGPSLRRPNSERTGLAKLFSASFV
ncbi:hypothetical protein EDB85DRAFT_1892552 [Lactarius pseudohatsudake]|nr:hypothetical protein EDB85DRAFT_1892552 [Lactarius pseudohatsudake]